MTTFESAWTLQALCSVFMAGVIWFVQMVHYPSFAEVRRDAFDIFHQRHVLSTTRLVAPIMLLELASSLATFYLTPPGSPRWTAYAGLALLTAIWTSTFVLQVPCHNRLAGGYDPAAHERLVSSNWIRTAGWSARALMLILNRP
jgi:hypothetical protein